MDDPQSDSASLFVLYDEILLHLVDKHAPLIKVTIQSRWTATWYDASCCDAKVNTHRLERFYRTSRASRTPAALITWRTLNDLNVSTELVVLVEHLLHSSPGGHSST